MDPDKVDAILKWPTPTNKGLLMGFLGSLGWLADDIAKVRVPMGTVECYHWCYGAISLGLL